MQRHIDCESVLAKDVALQQGWGDAGQTKPPPMNRNNDANGGYFVCPTSSDIVLISS
jgi:hypothetical protein